MLKLREHKLEKACPVCGSDLLVRIVEYNVPNYGDTIFLIIMCEKCGLKSVNAIPKEVFGKKVIKIKVRSKDDLRRKILKGENAKIKIPEFGIEVEESKGYISTLEGLVRHILDAFKDDRRIREIKTKLLDVKEEYTIIIEDEEGISREIEL